MRGEIITFYSYKGGTGRSMALANVGCLLAQRPNAPRVLLIDWDLEAPGLHRYFEGVLRNATVHSRTPVEERAGVIDLFAKLDALIGDRKLSEAETERLVAELPIEEYTISTDIERVDLITAGTLNSAFATHVSTFAWEHLFERAPALMRAFAARLASIYNYILIDSRTGLTDISGICTMLLPDKLAVVFTPNRQSLTGLADLVKRAARYRRESDDLRPLTVFPLPSRIDANEPDLRRLWRDGGTRMDGYEPHFEKLFKEVYGLDHCELKTYFDDVQVQHVPKYAYGEEIAVLQEDSSDRFSVAYSYQNFTERLASQQTAWSAMPERETERGLIATNLDWLVRAFLFMRRNQTGSLAAAVLILLGALAAIRLEAVELRDEVTQLAKKTTKSEYELRSVRAAYEALQREDSVAELLEERRRSDYVRQSLAKLNSDYKELYGENLSTTRALAVCNSEMTDLRARTDQAESSVSLIEARENRCRATLRNFQDELAKCQNPGQ